GASSGYLVRDWGSATSIWMDAGPGTFANLQQFTDPAALSAVVLSHQHDDHWSDVVGLLTALRWTMSFERDPITVLAAPGIREHVSQDYDGYFDWREIGDGDGAEVGPLRLQFSRTDHPPVTLGVRVEGASGVLGYSADSGPGWGLVSLGTDLDLALCEATYTEEHEVPDAIHLSGTQAGRSAKEAGARRLVITHRWAKLPAVGVEEEARLAFGGPVGVAEIGRGFSL
ncbi:MAG TPA: MBL fold metallo-hydrolase, partial [Acidimicrobiales bacterium]|nr:MBL fold metallo-hydrolase [Acidimicrobiales bacterium]